MSDLSNKVVDTIQCPKCRDEGRDTARDNLHVFDDGHGYCVAGHGFVKNRILENILKNQERYNTLRTTSGLDLSLLKEPLTTGKNLSSDPVDIPSPPTSSSIPNLSYNSWRGVDVETMKFYDVKSNPELIVFPWGPEARLIRRKDRKEFWWEGKAKDSQGLFGMERFPSGSTWSTVTILEGALDAMSLYQALGSKYACVAVKSAPSALADCTREFDYLNGFDKIKVCLDNDQVGQEAASKIVRLFDPLKVYWVRL